MTRRIALSVASLTLCAGSSIALAQAPVVDGVKDAAYGSPKWVNTANPTGFGNNGDPGTPCNGSSGSTGSFQGCYSVANVGGLTGCGNDSTGLRLSYSNLNTAGVSGDAVNDPGAVATGIEFSIPVASIGAFGTGQTIRLMAAINAGCHCFFSNQFLPGLPNRTGNLGGPGSINLNNFAGDQFAAFVPALVSTAPTIDGTLDGTYGAAIALQTTPTGFGDSNLGQAGPANGSELDGMYVVRYDNGTADPADDVLYVCLTGNIESNFNKFEFFFDTIDNAGQNTLFNSNADVDFNGLNAMAGLTFDSGFAPDFWLGGGQGGDTMFPNFATLPTCPPPPPPPTGDRDFASGSEIDAVYSYIDGTDLYIFVAGNLETGGGAATSNGGNKLVLFIDAQLGGQNRMLGSNVDISFGNLNRLGDDGTGNGLTWDDGFAPDYWLQYKNVGVIGNVSHVVDCAVLRTDGRRVLPFLGGALDYGAYYGGPKNEAQYRPATFNGNSAVLPAGQADPQEQDGSVANIYTNFAPRLTAESLVEGQVPPFGLPLNAPVGAANKITFDMDNGNTGGVNGTEAVGAAGVTKGFEIRIDLAELGYDGQSGIRLGGFIANNDYTFLSNQVIGGLPAGAGNLGGNQQNLNFNTIPGQQWVTLVDGGNPCRIDFNNDGNVDPDDLSDVISCFFDAGCNFDYDGSGVEDPDDLADYIADYFGPPPAGC